MREQFEKIMNYQLGEIVSSPLIIELLSLYSKLYLNGGQPSSCESCIRKYYSELKQTGMARIIKIEEIKNRTLIPGWNGLLWIPSVARHFDSAMITDDEACAMLKNGQLREKHFNKLPDGWLNYILKTKPPIEEKQTIENKSKPRTHKKKIK